jgi:hypothetical protein
MGLQCNILSPAGNQNNLETPWGMVLESGKNLTVRASATTTKGARVKIDSQIGHLEKRLRNG